MKRAKVWFVTFADECRVGVCTITKMAPVASRVAAFITCAYVCRDRLQPSGVSKDPVMLRDSTIRTRGYELRPVTSSSPHVSSPHEWHVAATTSEARVACACGRGLSERQGPWYQLSSYHHSITGQWSRETPRVHTTWERSHRLRFVPTTLEVVARACQEDQMLLDPWRSHGHPH